MRRLVPIFGTRGAVGEGGGGQTTFSTLQAVVDAIDLAELEEGQSWTITWASDTYLGAGSVYGTVYQGKPYWRGLLPSYLLGTSLSAISGAYTLDADGRPVLSATGDGTSTDNLDLGLLLGAFGQIRMSAHYTSGIPSVSGTGAANLFVGKQGSEDINSLSAGLVYFGGWQVYGTGISNPFAALSPAPDFTGGLNFTVGLNVWRLPTLPNPRALAIGQHSSNALQNFDASGSVDLGMGDWRTALNLVPRVRHRDVGAPATLVFTGLEAIL